MHPTAPPLNVCFVWHMHQPDYKDHLTGRYLMPWARLHGLKDYLDMVTLLGDYPAIRQTFNLVPSLMDQLEEVARPGIWDRYQAVTAAEHWTDEDRRFILARFFDANVQHMVGSHPAYVRLHQKRLRYASPHEAAAAFSDEELADLTVLFHLAWTDPRWRRETPTLQGLWEKGAHFSLADRRSLLETQQHILAKILPTYRQFQDSGQIEVSVSPYYHPILPLLVDAHSARVGNPMAVLPDIPFQHPEDARQQMRLAMARYEALLGRPARGVWPSEQSVSPAVLALLGELGLQWAISSEGVLARSLRMHWEKDDQGNIRNLAPLVQTYDVSGVRMVFRHLTLSDLIGFHYQHVPAQQAAQDFYGRLKQIQHHLAASGGPKHPVVTVALDGENCWEGYFDDGIPFLRALYQHLSEDDTLNITTVSEALAMAQPQPLPNLHAGSWIEDNFNIWIGDPMKNTAWTYLAQARETLVTHEAGLSEETKQRAWQEIYIAEGSDWFWWFGEPHTSGQDELFDMQFRLHLANVYKLLDLPVPPALERPVPATRDSRMLVPLGWIHPKINGRWDDAPAWVSAGCYDFSWSQVTTTPGVMHREDRPVKRFFYGEDADYLYLRFELSHDQLRPHHRIVLYWCNWEKVRHNSPLRLKLNRHKRFDLERYMFAYEMQIDGLAEGVVQVQAAEAAPDHLWADLPDWQAEGTVRAVLDDLLDLRLPYDALGTRPYDKLALAVAIAEDEVVSEMVPRHAPIIIRRASSR